MIAVAIQLVDKSTIYQPKYIVVIAASFLLILCTRVNPAVIIVGPGLRGAMLG